MNDLDDSLTRGLARLGMEIPVTGQRKILAYLELLAKWNRRFNLTAVRDIRHMLPRHVFDSLVTLPHIQGPHVLDVGTGPGLPGLILALAKPDWEFVLVDSNAKKARFLTQALIELSPANVNVVCCPIEKFRAGTPFNTIICRAFTNLSRFYTQTVKFCADDGCLAAMKGIHPTTEIAELDGFPVVIESIRLDVPELDAERHLIMMRKRGDIE